MKHTDKHKDMEAVNSPQWEKLYVLTEHWQSDLEFYRDDLRFLHNLVDKYFIWITKSENLEIVRELMIQVHQIEKRCEYLLQEINGHKHDLSQLSHQFVQEDYERIAKHHESMESEIYEFVKQFRANRKEVFRITEYVIDSEELTDLIKS